MDRVNELKKIEDFLTIDDQLREKLLKINDLRFLKLLTPLIFLAYLNRRLTHSDDSILLITFYIASMESIQRLKSGDKNKTELVSTFLKNNLQHEDKIKLLRSFAFSKKHKFKEKSGNPYHLMRDDYVSAITNSYEIPEEFCLTGDRPECQCIVWLRENKFRTDTFVEKLAFHLYKMRCAVLHDVSGVLWVHDFESNGNSSGTLYDAYSTGNNYFINYESGINRSEFYQIMKPTFENFLLHF